LRVRADGSCGSLHNICGGEEAPAAPADDLGGLDGSETHVETRKAIGALATSAAHWFSIWAAGPSDERPASGLDLGQVQDRHSVQTDTHEQDPPAERYKLPEWSEGVEAGLGVDELSGSRSDGRERAG